MEIASVAISSATREFDKEYHYTIPPSFSGTIKPGMRVIVPFGKGDRTLEAIVTDVVSSTEINGLKEIKKVSDVVPAIKDDLIRLSWWMKNKYICTFYDAVKCMLPPGSGVKSIRMVQILKNEASVNDNEGKIISALLESGNICKYEELRDKTGLKYFSKLIKSLEKKEIVRTIEDYSYGISEKTVKAAYLSAPRDVVVEEIESGRLNRIQHIRVLEMLLECEYMAVSDITRYLSVSDSVVNTLRKNGYIDFMDVEIKRDPLKNRVFERTSPFSPTEQQAEVLKVLKDKLFENKFSEYLLHGITGSGKTEVYLQLIEYSIKNGKNAIVLVPEISLTPQMVERFMGRFGKDVAIIHSRLSPGERYDQWRLVRDGGVKVVVGVRSAVFAPLSDIGIIIIDEEHETTYKSDITPRFHAIDVARERCIYNGALLMKGSATPSIESYYKAQNGKSGFLEMTKRANNKGLPDVIMVDMRNELSEGNRSIFSRALSSEISKNMEQKMQTILFLNRRGYASFVLCRECGYTARCVSCNISLTYHAKEGRLICHYCGYTVKMPEICPKCKSKYIRHFGTGTQKVEEELKKVFPGISTVRMDMDTTLKKNSHEKILSSFREENIDVMVGTQMIAKGHDFPGVTLVGVLAADSLLNLEDFRASERTFQLVTQVAGRAGRGLHGGRVVIQTYNTEDFSIKAACRQDYGEFYKNEILIREKLGYPPFSNVAIIILSGTEDTETKETLLRIKEYTSEEFAKCEVEADVLGPSRAPLSKINNRYRWRIVIKCGCEDSIIKVFDAVQARFRKMANKDGVRMTMDINPYNMM